MFFARSHLSLVKCKLCTNKHILSSISYLRLENFVIWGTPRLLICDSYSFQNRNQSLCVTLNSVISNFGNVAGTVCLDYMY